MTRRALFPAVNATVFDDVVDAVGVLRPKSLFECRDSLLPVAVQQMLGPVQINIEASSFALLCEPLVGGTVFEPVAGSPSQQQQST